MNDIDQECLKLQEWIDLEPEMFFINDKSEKSLKIFFLLIKQVKKSSRV